MNEQESGEGGVSPQGAVGSTTVRAEVVVPAEPARAFDVFVERFDAWWPPEYGLTDGPVAAFVLEPGPEGRWYERTEAGEVCEWGRVLRWEPPHRITLEWAVSPE